MIRIIKESSALVSIEFQTFSLLLLLLLLSRKYYMSAALASQGLAALKTRVHRMLLKVFIGVWRCQVLFETMFWQIWVKNRAIEAQKVLWVELEEQKKDLS